MRGVGVVRRHDPAPTEGSRHVGDAAAALGDEPLHEASQPRTDGSGRRRRADFLVVEQREDRDAAGRLRREEGEGGGAARREVVEAGSREEVAVDAEPARRGQVVEHQVPRHDPVGLDAGLRCHELPQLALATGADAPQRGQVTLGVEAESVVHPAVEVDGELSDPEQGTVHGDELGTHRATRLVEYPEPTGQPEVAVQPRVAQDPSVDLDPDLAPARGAGVGPGADPQVRAVGVGSEHRDRRVRRGPVGHGPRQQLTAPHLDTAQGQLAVGVGVDAGEARLGQIGGEPLGGVVRRGAGVDEGGEIVSGVHGHLGILAPGGRRPDLPSTRMRLESAVVHRVAVPMHTPFSSAATVVRRREVLVVELHTDVGGGWGECVALATPDYLADHLDGEELVLVEYVLPALLGVDLAPPDLSQPTSDVLASHVGLVGHPTARAAVVDALLDADLRSRGRGLAAELGVTATTVPVGLAVGMLGTDADAVAAIVASAEAAQRQGVGRLKLKVAPGADRHVVAVRDALGEGMTLHVDANGSYPRGADLGWLDGVGVELVEQPHDRFDLAAHVATTSALSAMVGLDESFDDHRRIGEIVALGAADAVCVKPGPLGGIDRAVATIEAAHAAGLVPWIGGMLETGLGRAPLAALAALADGPTGDLAPPSAYLADDVVTERQPLGPEAIVHRGPGLSPQPDPEALTRLATRPPRRLNV